MTSSCITNTRWASTFLAIHTVYVLTINMLSNILCDTPFMAYVNFYMFRHRDTIFRESL